MNSIINQNRLVELMSQLSGRDTATCESFVAAFTAVVREGLADYEEVTVPGFGRFSLEGMESKIVFSPDKQMAADVNAPFEMFVPEDLAPEVDDEQLAAIDATTSKTMADGIPVPKPWAEEEEPEQSPSQETEQNPSQKSEVKSQEIQHSSSQETAAISQVPEPSSIQEQEAGNQEPTVESRIQAVESQKTMEPSIARSLPSQDPEVEDTTCDMPDDQYEEKEVASKPSKFWMIWALVVGFLLGLAVGFFVHDPIQEALEPSISDEYDSSLLEDEIDQLAEAFDAPTMENAQEKVEQVEDKTTIAPTEQPKQEMPKAPAAKTETKPQAKTVYDSVRSGYYLTSMAKKHYGYDKYWVYIYLENKNKITNPNRISTETKLVIPPLEKYAPGGDTPENRAAAAKKEAEINRRFK